MNQEEEIDPKNSPQPEPGSGESQGSTGGARMSGKGVPSDAPNASFETGAGEEATGFDSPPVASSTLSNPEYTAGGSAEARSDAPPDEWEGDMGIDEEP